ncbi:Inorganic pyrophosphatase [Hymenobacter roseosalivarius DSM 11622]|uniref:inorganic diphosphatase n=1 Tax=Hymenobacter roseosalivarius DSM 11622 TaxID=645990 RepID=A0A1W1VUP5_9BACT|nr:inorganic diphosphatase [Hymenobacter roseosalivarius]SMB97097.1 Inorganic pyrophosphatase [Hymenobacter roseosalivarius DSM 11622]
MRGAKRLLGSLLIGLSVAGCQTDYTELPTFSAERKLLQAVIEVPAGTNLERRYDPATHEFAPQQRAGKDRVLEFLPYPGNYGFVPGTNTATGGPLPVLVLAESQPTGTVLEVLPLGLLLLDNAGALERVVLAVPARPSQQILRETSTWAAFIQRYPAAHQILRLWFQQRASPGTIRIMGWKDEQAAVEQVRSVMR